MSVTPDTAVSIEMPYKEWANLCQELAGYGYQHELGALGMIERQLPTLTPTGLGAVVRAEPTNIGPNVLPVVLVFCSKGDSPQDKLSWRDPYEGSWYEPDDFHVTEVLSQGIPWPTA